MSDAEWDAEDFEPNLNVVKTDKWEGEDEEDAVKDNWDDDDDEEEKEEKEEVQVVIKKKKTLKEKIAEREAAKQKELEEKLEKQKKELERSDAEWVQAEKERVRRIQEEADLELALEAFGLNEDDSKKLGPIEQSRPQTKEDFNKFSNLLYDKIIKYKDSKFFGQFIENVFRDLALGVDPEDIKKLSASLTALYNEKLKISKKNKKTKKTIAEKSDKDEFAEFADYM